MNLLDMYDLEADGHTVLDYRPEGESRHTPPADVCAKCSDLEAGRLVPVSLCPALGPLVKQQYAAFLGETWRQIYGS